MFDIFELSVFVVNYSSIIGHPMNNLKLQKVLYYIQKEFAKDNKLAFSEPITHWRWGPVVEIIYENFKDSIVSRIPYIDEKTFVIKSEKGIYSIIKKDNLIDFENKSDINIVKRVIEEYKQHTPIELAKLSMSEPDWINTDFGETIKF